MSLVPSIATSKADVMHVLTSVRTVPPSLVAPELLVTKTLSDITSSPAIPAGAFPISCALFLPSVTPNSRESNELAHALAGLLADGLIKQGVGITQVRKRLQTVAFLGPALALIILSRSKDPRVAVACMTCALGITSLGECRICVQIP